MALSCLIAWLSHQSYEELFVGSKNKNILKDGDLLTMEINPTSKCEAVAKVSFPKGGN